MLHVWKKLIKLKSKNFKTESKFTREIGECMKISRKKASERLRKYHSFHFFCN